jgi:hypothetical protein
MNAWWALILVLASSAPALACEIATCGDAPVLLPQLDSVPINAVAFQVVRDDFTELRMTDVTDLGNMFEIPSSVKGAGANRIWSSDVQLRVGQWVQASWRTSCYEGAAKWPIAEAASLDQKASLELTEYGANAPHGERRVWANLVYSPPTSSPNYLRLDVEVDGKPYRVPAQDPWYVGPQLDAMLWARCDRQPADACEEPSVLTAERHEVTFHAYAVGQKVTNTMQLTIDLRCDVTPERSDAIEAVEDQGCQLSGSHGSGVWLLLALFGRRRRR